jgi:hypothetical protein
MALRRGIFHRGVCSSVVVTNTSGASPQSAISETAPTEFYFSLEDGCSGSCTGSFLIATERDNFRRGNHLLFAPVEFYRSAKYHVV